MTFFRLDGVAVVGAGGGDGWVSSDNIIVSFLAYDRVDGMVKGLVKVKRFYVLRSATCYGVGCCTQSVRRTSRLSPT